MPTRQCELQPAVDVEEPARAVTHKDIADLSRAGIGEAVLIELIEMDDIAHPLARPRLRVSVLKNTQACRGLRPGAAGVAPQ